MTTLLEKAGQSFLRAFGVTFLFYVTGILAAPDKSTAISLSIAALVASIVAGLRVIQVLVPQLSFAGLVGQPYGSWLDSFSRAFLSALIVGITGWLAAPELVTNKAVILAILIGAVTAGVRAIQGLTTKGELPAPETGR